ncbi:hypothetical protein [Mycolicibacterium canariasense]|uniref:hypothetical protein n=1 Tax=Mycolicibacterium canariasense TaxID=228230 RepID=UPI0032D5AC1E
MQPGAVAAYDALDRHVHAVEKAQWLAEKMCSSQYVPAKFQGKPADGAAAILFGAEVGLSPIASLRSVIVIHGMPGFEARTMKAILMGHGYRFRTLEATRDVCRVYAQSPNGDEAQAEITLDDCKLEGWVPQPVADLDHEPNPDTKTDWVGEWKSGRNGDYYVVEGNMKYITSPRTMLIAKATAAVCRDIAPHLLLGMPAAEDMQDWDDDDFPAATANAPKRRAGGRGVGGLRARAAAAQQQKEDAVDVEIVDDEATNETPPQETPVGAGDTNEAATEVENTTADPDQGSDLRKSTRKQLNSDIGTIFREIDLNGEDQGADRLIVVCAIVGRQVKSAADLNDDDLQKLRNDLTKRKADGTLQSDVTEWINAATVAEYEAQQAAEGTAKDEK